MGAALGKLLHDPQALEELLRSGRVRRAPGPGSPDFADPRKRSPLPFGVPSLDAALGGGLARGSLHEIVAPPSAGGTALLRAALAAATRAGELCALIDPADSFDPAATDIDLRRLLWVRPAQAVQALRAVEIALEARFALVVLDLGELAAPKARARTGQIELVTFQQRAPRAGASAWARLARRAERHGGAVLVLTRSAQAGTFAAATVELERGATRWEGGPGAPGRLLRGAMTVGAVARAKRFAPSGPLPLQLSLEQR